MTAEELREELLEYPTLRKLLINGPPQAFYDGVSELVALINTHMDGRQEWAARECEARALNQECALTDALDDCAAAIRKGPET